ncbi:unnamed protein product [Mytilus coruscus]|uniref:Uncharacterized protein n=1 Tax=Mytilus coruscus TaxID=42192 RepID=A0A6J8CM33_MYTCO|nr:unnamed protein product [Mytilus coruscus]
MKVVNPDFSLISRFRSERDWICFDVVYIGDNSVAVTSSVTINIFNVQNKKAKKTLNIDSANYGVTLNDGKLIYCSEDKGLKMISLSYESINSITTRKMSSLTKVATHGDKLFYTNEINHNITCCDFSRNTVWTFNESSILNHQFGISVDNDGNVYVVGAWFHNMVVISTYGRRYRQLLSKKDGLNCPKAVVYDRSHNKLLIANESKNAFVYDVV